MKDTEKNLITRKVIAETVRLNKAGEIIDKTPLETIEYVLMLPGGIEMPFVKIPAGVFNMGALPQNLALLN